MIRQPATLYKNTENVQQLVSATVFYFERNSQHGSKSLRSSRFWAPVYLVVDGSCNSSVARELQKYWKQEAGPGHRKLYKSTILSAVANVQDHLVLLPRAITEKILRLADIILDKGREIESRKL